MQINSFPLFFNDYNFFYKFELLSVQDVVRKSVLFFLRRIVTNVL